MERFLRFGPEVATSPQDPAAVDGNSSVKMLNVDFTIGEGEELLETEDYDEWMHLQVKHAYGHEDGEEIPPNFHGSRVMRHEWLADFVTGYLDPLVAMNYHTEEYSAIVMERVGTIQINVNGVLLEGRDLARVLNGINWGDPGDTFGHVKRKEGLQAFSSGKRAAQRMRIGRGLPVI